MRDGWRGAGALGWGHAEVANVVDEVVAAVGGAEGGGDDDVVDGVGAVVGDFDGDGELSAGAVGGAGAGEGEVGVGAGVGPEAGVVVVGVLVDGRGLDEDAVADVGGFDGGLGGGAQAEDGGRAIGELGDAGLDEAAAVVDGAEAGAGRPRRRIERRGRAAELFEGDEGDVRREQVDKGDVAGVLGAAVGDGEGVGDRGAGLEAVPVGGALDAEVGGREDDGGERGVVVVRIRVGLGRGERRGEDEGRAGGERGIDGEGDGTGLHGDVGVVEPVVPGEDARVAVEGGPDA